jgi:HlyD family secretion protein
LNGYTSKVNGHLSTLLSAGTTITNYKDSIISSDRTIREKELSLEDTKEGADDIDIRTQELVVDQKKEDLRQAQETLAEYSIRAPFSGIMASVDIVSGDAVNSGATIGSIVTNDKIANITLNEVDIAKVKLGQKVDITFDALDDLLVEGEVAEIDTLGTVSQGVVSYNVKISFDTKDERVKPGMSITANIIVDSVEDVITISSGAIKTIGKASFVEVMLEDGKTERKKVETGISDDVMIEIKSGINEGDKIVTQTIAGTVKKNTTSKSTVPGGGQEMNNIMRITR